ncbi:MAG: hypothetical protein KY464_12660, partial [Gemmatimonadetes bacterium]|nr:hypothetical protein [Gemmatimonadota bacterium]
MKQAALRRPPILALTGGALALALLLPAGTAAQFGGGGFGGRGGGRGVQPGSPGARLTPSEVRSYPASTPLYDTAALRTIFITFESPDWERELSAFYGTDVEVPATV